MRTLLFVVALAASVAFGENPRLADQAAWDSYKKQPWRRKPTSCPARPPTPTEFWQAESFDEPTIERELAIAQATGFNTCRVFTQYLVWKHDPEGLRSGSSGFLAIARKHHISVVPTLFTIAASAIRPCGSRTWASSATRSPA